MWTVGMGAWERGCGEREGWLTMLMFEATAENRPLTADWGTVGSPETTSLRGRAVVCGGSSLSVRVQQESAIFSFVFVGCGCVS